MMDTRTDKLVPIQTMREQGGNSARCRVVDP